MKICLALDQANLGAFYIYFLIKEYYKTCNIQFDTFLNPYFTTGCFSKNDLVNSSYNESLISYAKFGTPNPGDYDVLAIGAICNKQTTLITPQLIRSFLAAGKKVVVVKNNSDATYTPYACMDISQKGNTDILYGVPFQHFGFSICTNELESAVSKDQMFHMNSIDLYTQSKPLALNKDEFYRKYKLDPNLNIIGFFPGGMHGHPSYKIEHKLHQKMRELNNTLKELGYQVVAKLHYNEYYGHKSSFYGGKLSSEVFFEDIATIPAEDTYELLKYAKYSLTSSTSMTFEHYLYDLPAINIGLADKDSQEHTTQHCFDYCQNNKDFNLEDHVFGDIYKADEFFMSPRECFEKSFNTNHDILSFQRRNNNKFHGDSYDQTIKSLCDNLTNAIVDK
jgi:hypothetical protein